MQDTLDEGGRLTIANESSLQVSDVIDFFA